MKISELKMFDGGYVVLFKSYVLSKGLGMIGKQVMPFYVIIIVLSSIYLYMENSNIKVILYVVLSIAGLPLLVLGFHLSMLFLKAMSSSKKIISIIDKNIVIRKDGKEKIYYSNLYIKYFDECFIDFINKDNPFESHALFGDVGFLYAVVGELKKNGFEVFNVKNKEVNR